MNTRKVICLVTIVALATLLMAQTKPSVNRADVMANGAKVYKQYCISCHQADAAGVPQLNPPLIKTPLVLGNTKSLITIMIKGKTGPVKINGEVYTAPMPPQVLLNDQQIADVLSYIRNNFGNKASLVSVEEVKKIRTTIK